MIKIVYKKKENYQLKHLHRELDRVFKTIAWKATFQATTNTVPPEKHFQIR